MYNGWCTSRTTLGSFELWSTLDTNVANIHLLAHLLSYNAKLIKAKPDLTLDPVVDQVGTRYIVEGLLVDIVAFDITGQVILFPKHDEILNGDSRGMVVQIGGVVR